MFVLCGLLKTRSFDRVPCRECIMQGFQIPKKYIIYAVRIIIIIINIFQITVLVRNYHLVLFIKHTVKFSPYERAVVPSFNDHRFYYFLLLLVAR